jgi:hypothetical protein
MPVMAELQSQAVTGVTANQTGECLVREAWPSVASAHPAAAFARRCFTSGPLVILLAPIGWIVLAPFLLNRIAGMIIPGLGGMAKRYKLTNRRLCVCKGAKATVNESIPLDEIKEVKLKTDEVSDYYFAGTLEIIGHDDKVLMTLPGVREAESFGHAIRQTATAWGPLLKS